VSNQTPENLVGDLEDWIFEISRLVRKGHQLSPEATVFLQNIHPALDKLSEEMLEDEHAWNEMKQAEAEESDVIINAYLQSVRGDR
jgi:hypothetical protein|tara:strand:+ start:87 stop:344 length:258 start_codon:yes stop_codon:yes gene_type:complete